MSTAHGKIDYGKCDSSSEPTGIDYCCPSEVQWGGSIRAMTLNSLKKDTDTEEEGGMYVVWLLVDKQLI